MSERHIAAASKATRVAFMRSAARQMRASWQSDENADPAEAQFYCAVADYLDSEDTHRFGPTEHAINIARAYLGSDL